MTIVIIFRSVTSQALIKYPLGRREDIILILLIGKLKCEATNPKWIGNKVNTRTHHYFAYSPKSLLSQNAIVQNTITACKIIVAPYYFPYLHGRIRDRQFQTVIIHNKASLMSYSGSGQLALHLTKLLHSKSSGSMVQSWLLFVFKRT